MNEVTLVAKYDDNYGMMGIYPRQLPGREELNAASEGVLVAHDIFEHVNGIENIGGAGDELMALGAVWHTCGALGDINRKHPQYHSSEESISSDIVNCFHRWMAEEEHFEWPMPDPGDELDRDTIRYMFQYAWKEVRDYTEHKPGAWMRFCLGARHYLNAGYRCMQERYHCSARSNHIFWTIADAVDHYIFDRHVELYEGMEWLLKFNEDECECVIEEVEDVW